MSTEERDDDKDSKQQFAELMTHRLEDVDAKAIEWLWQPYIPLGKLTLLDGDPGSGKSHIAQWIAAQVTNGSGFPGGPSSAPTGNVLIFSAEEDASDTLKPRLLAMGADCTRIEVVSGVVTKDGRRTPDFRFDLELVAAKIREVEPLLVIFDPVLAYVGARTDINRANQTRSVLAPLAEIIRFYGCACICIRHLNKSETGRGIYRGLGSIDFLAAVRSALMVAPNPNTDAESVLFHYKSNVGPKGPPLGYLISGRGFEWTSAHPELVLDDALASSVSTRFGSFEEARVFLLALMQDGCVRADEALRESKRAGIPHNALQKAKGALRMFSVREGGVASRGFWVWRVVPASGERTEGAR